MPQNDSGHVSRYLCIFDTNRILQSFSEKSRGIFFVCSSSFAARRNLRHAGNRQRRDGGDGQKGTRGTACVQRKQPPAGVRKPEGCFATFLGMALLMPQAQAGGSLPGSWRADKIG
jgi:hypothetical protein